MVEKRPSNIERRRLREECRDTLAMHIKSKLGIVVHPSQVRLIPKTSDPYRWKDLPGHEEINSKLFSKNISDHSVNAYRQLCEGVDKTFEAVLSCSPITEDLQSIVSLRCPEVSFSARIQQLEFENADIFHQLCQWKDRATTECERKEHMEQEVNHLRESNQRLEDRLDEYADAANYLTGRVLRCLQGLDTVVPLLQELKSEVALENPLQ